jgi:hypothetical protein
MVMAGHEEAGLGVQVDRSCIWRQREDSHAWVRVEESVAFAAVAFLAVAFEGV